MCLLRDRHPNDVDEQDPIDLPVLPRNDHLTIFDSYTSNRGPISGSGSGGGVTGRVVDADRRDVPRVEVLGLVTAGSDTSGSSFFASSVVSEGGFSAGGAGVRLPAGRRPRALLAGVGLGLAFLGSGDSTGFSSDVGSGVGATATSTGAGSGSSILAPTEFTLFVFRPVLGFVVLVSSLSTSAISGPPTAGANDPPKNN